MELMFSNAQSYMEVQQAFVSIMQFGMYQPQNQYRALVGYRMFLKKIETENKKKAKDERIYDTAFYAFMAVQEYLTYIVEEKNGYIRNDPKMKVELLVQKLTPMECEIFKEPQLMLWERIEKYVISEIPKEIKRDKDEYYEVYSAMYEEFVSKMIFRYEPYSPNRKSLVRPTTYFKYHIYQNALTKYWGKRLEMTSYEIQVMNKIKKAINGMWIKNTDPTVEKISELTGLSMKVVNNMLVELKRRKIVSLNETVKDNEGEEKEIIHLLIDGRLSPEDEVIKKENDLDVNSILDKANLTREEKQVLIQRYALDESQKKKGLYKDIARNLGLTEKDVKKIEGEAKSKLYKILKQ